MKLDFRITNNNNYIRLESTSGYTDAITPAGASIWLKSGAFHWTHAPIPADT
jgi:hypothetical protein